MTIKLFRQRKERETEALEVLRKIENYGSFGYPLFGKLASVNIQRVASGEDTPRRALRKLDDSLKYRDSSVDEVLKESEAFEKLSPQDQRVYTEQKQADYLHYLRVIRSKKFQSALERWVANAEPILTDIVKNNMSQMIGLKYYDHFSGGNGEGAIHMRIDSEDNLTMFSAYGDIDSEGKPNAKAIANGVLKQISLQGNLSYERIGCYGQLMKFNHKRNEIVKDIQKRTGRNLKREVMEMNKKMKTDKPQIQYRNSNRWVPRIGQIVDDARVNGHMVIYRDLIEPPYESSSDPMLKEIYEQATPWNGRTVIVEGYRHTHWIGKEKVQIIPELEREKVESELRAIITKEDERINNLTLSTPPIRPVKKFTFWN